MMWVPDDKYPWTWVPSEESARKKNGIYFDTKPPIKKWLFRGKSLPMHLCRSCKLGLVDCAPYMDGD